MSTAVQCFTIAFVVLCGAAVATVGAVQPVRAASDDRENAADSLAVQAASDIVGIAVLGDSVADEYRADDDRGGIYENVTFNWVEQLARNRNLNFGPWGTWGGSRRSGYEYNWARSGADVASMIGSGQHTGAAEQVQNGLVSHVFIQIGGNDFSVTDGTYGEIYSGAMSSQKIQWKLDRFMANLTEGVETIMDAGDVSMVIVTVGDPGLAPGIDQVYPNEEGRQRVTRVIDALNARIVDLADEHGAYVVDVNDFLRSMSDEIENGILVFGGVSFFAMERGNNPRYLWLDDDAGHPGTVASGMAANALFIDSFNAGFGAGIQPLSASEILSNAGLGIVEMSEYVYLPYAGSEN